MGIECEMRTISGLVQWRMLSAEYLLMDIASGSNILQAIQSRAEQKWGDRWMANLVREYVEIIKERGYEKDQNATTVNRRPHLERAFKTGGCTLDTAIALAAAVGCRFQMVCTEVKVQTF